MATHAELLKKYPEANSAEYLANTKPQPGKRHVVLSTKYGDPWFGISVQVKLALIKQGCTVYNPNTDNLSLHDGDTSKANSAWLLTFNNNLEDVQNSEGFVMQLQQGADQLKSDMQLAEEKQAGWLHVPRIGMWFQTSESSGLFKERQEIHMPRAVELAASQWAKGILSHVEMANETYETVRGHAGDVVSRNGYLKVTYPLREGDAVPEVYEGEMTGGKYHGRGMIQYANGHAYDGEFQSGVRHGNGVYTFADGRVYHDGQWRNGDKV